MPDTVAVPSITTEQMREVDRLMIEEYGIALLQMMENAGRNLASLALTQAGAPAGLSVLVLAGKGNNGGGGMAAARHLSNAGARASVLLTTDPHDLTGVPAHQASILNKMGIELRPVGTAREDDLRRAFAEASVILDAIIGYSLSGAPRGATARLIETANASGKPVVSLDVPSGVDADSGEVYEPSIRATVTLTLALPKTGLGFAQVRERLGDLYLADISVPPGLYRHLGLEVAPLFAEGRPLRLGWSGQDWTLGG